MCVVVVVPVVMVVLASVFVLMRHVVGVTRSGITRSAVSARVVAAFPPAWRLVGVLLLRGPLLAAVMMMMRCMLAD